MDKECDSLQLQHEALGRPASPGEKGTEISRQRFHSRRCHHPARRVADGQVMDCQLAGDHGASSALHVLLTTAKLIKKNAIQTEAVKTFLEAPAQEALKMLQDAWLESADVQRTETHARHRLRRRMDEPAAGNARIPVEPARCHPRRQMVEPERLCPRYQTKIRRLPTPRR